jgi:predicted ABC-type ATPase
MKAVLLMKARRRSDLVPVKKQITRGGKSFMQTVWVSPQDAAKMGGQKADVETTTRPVGQKYGMHNIEAGDYVSFGYEGNQITGKVKLAGKDGVTATFRGQEHHILWKDIRRFTPKTGTKKPDYNDQYYNMKKEFIEPDKFTAGEWKKQFDVDDPTSETILASFEDAAAIRKAITDTEDRLERLEQTITWHRKSGKDEEAEYDKEREVIHAKILGEILSPAKIIAAKPSKGEKPKFIMLGGRGGSGKSWFKGKVYEPNKSIVLDADEIKGMLPEYEGWNAAQVHEESSDILETALHMARKLGLNVVLDATMKTAKSAIKKVEAFKDAGYSIEAHYMHLPRQEAAKRAVSRFMGKTKRYVPIDVVLGNTSNEDSFDQIKQIADKWSFRDNNVKQGNEPILISESKGK